MNVLELVQSAGDQVGTIPPTSLITTDQVARKWKNILIAECQYLRNQRIFPQQKRSYTITSVNGQASYDLPDDYYSSLPGTEWDNTRRWALTGPLSDANFNLIAKGVSATTRLAYRIFGQDLNTKSVQAKLQFAEAPTANGELYTIDYVSKNLFLPTGWSASSTTPVETITANTDLCVFDDDIVLEGLKYRWLKSSGQDFDLEYKTHRDLVDQAVSRWSRTYRGRLDRISRGSRYQTQAGGWNL